MTKIAMIAMLLHYTPVPVYRSCTTWCQPPICDRCQPICYTDCYDY